MDDISNITGEAGAYLSGIYSTALSVWETQDLAQRTVEHMSLFAAAFLIALLLGVALGVALSSRPAKTSLLFRIFAALKTLPGYALIAILIPVAGMGQTPAIIAAVLLSIIPISKKTYVGLTSASKKHAEVAKTLGLSPADVLLKVKLPLAAPVIMSGMRTAAAYTMGIVTLAGLISAGGLGAAIQAGIAAQDKDAIIVSCLWLFVLSLALDAVAVVLRDVMSAKYSSD